MPFTIVISHVWVETASQMERRSRASPTPQQELEDGLKQLVGWIRPAGLTLPTPL